MTTQPTPTESTQVDQMAAELERTLKQLTAERTAVRADRDEAVARLKFLDGEIDKAERMTKALIPRHRSSSSKKPV